MIEDLNPAFHEYAEIFTKVFSLRRDPITRARNLHDILSSYYPSGDQIKIADMGCGGGHLSAALHSLGYKVYGLDRSRQMLKIAQEQHGSFDGLTWVYADILANPPLLCADVVLALYSFLQSMPREESALRCLTYIRTILKHRGIALLEFENDPVVSKKYPEGIKSTWESEGFRVTSWSQSDGSDYLILTFDIHNISDLSSLPIRFSHRLRRMNSQAVIDLVDKVGGEIIDWCAAPLFSQEFDPETSEGMLAIVTFY
jgi:SAM-dependent methyltransferase